MWLAEIKVRRSLLAQLYIDVGYVARNELMMKGLRIAKRG